MAAVMNFLRQFKFDSKKSELDYFLGSIQHRHKHTPDITQLTRREKALVFLYDDCMRGHPNHDRLVKGFGKMECTAFTANTYSLWKKKLGPASFPVALSTGYTGAPPKSVKGELYSLSVEQIFELDKHRENMQQYTRIRVPILIPHRAFVFLKERVEVPGEPGTEPELLSSFWLDGLVDKVNAYMYVGKGDYWHPQLDAGFLFTPVNRYFNTKQNLDYYYYSTQEYNEQRTC